MWVHPSGDDAEVNSILVAMVMVPSMMMMMVAVMEDKIMLLTVMVKWISLSNIR